jgi:hypothetical protein
MERHFLMSKPTVAELLMLNSHLTKVDDEAIEGHNEDNDGNVATKWLADNTVTTTNAQVPTGAQKWWCSLLLGMLFAIVSSCWLYGITNWMSKKCTGTVIYKSGGPSLAGLLLHTVIFTLLVRLILR